MSEQVTQREATYNAIKSVLTSKGVSFEDGTDVKEVLSADMRKEVKTILFEGIRGGIIAYNKSSSDTELNSYCNGLISNWLKKDKRLNGNTKYEIKNKGSRAGQGDEQAKELRKLLKQVAGTKAESEVAKALQTRIDEVKASKQQKAIEINVEALPEHLRHLVK